MTDSPGGREVDRISINVVPDTSQFETLLRAQLDAVATTLKISIPTVLDTTGLLEEARAAATATQAAVGSIDLNVNPGGGDPVVKGAAYGDAFGTALGTRLEAALKALPNVDVDIDTSEIDLKIDLIRKQLTDLSTTAKVGVDINDVDIASRIAALQTDLISLQASSPNINVQFDAAKAITELIAVDAILDDVARSRQVDVNVGSAVTDIGSLAQAASGAVSPLGSLGDALTQFGGVGEALQSLGPIGDVIGITALGTAATAAIPALASTLGAVVALGTAAATTAGAVGLFAALAAPLASEAEQVSGLSNAWAQLQASTHVEVFQALDSVFTGLASAVGTLKPVIDAISPVIDSFGQDLQSIFGSDQWAAFVASISGEVAPVLADVLNIVVNLGTAFAGLTTAFAPLAETILGAITQWSAGFANIGSSNGLTEFIDYVDQNGPVLVDVLRQTIGIVGQLVEAFAPVGSQVLQELDAALTVLNEFLHVPGVTELITAMGELAATFGGVGLALAPLADDAGKVIGVFEGVPKAIGDVFSDADHWLVDAGESIVDGLLNGIEGAWDDLIKDIENLADTIPNAVKSVLGIFSPSRVMYAIGGNVTAGFAGGILDSAAAVTNAAVALAAPLTALGSQVGGVSGTVIAAVASPSESAPNASGAGSATAVFYDTDGVLIGSMRGVVADAQSASVVAARKGGGR
ncbi:MAG TPA: hypothetical protein VGL75_10955 [Acidothermaceae bacterium]|jgi:hypothetical protein